MGKDDSQTREERVDDIVMQSVDNLRKSELITQEEDYDVIMSTEYGDIMSKVCPSLDIVLGWCRSFLSLSSTTSAKKRLVLGALT